MIVAGDFETTYSKDYTLTKMSEVEYILDPRFQPIMLSLKLGNQPSEIHIGEDAIARRLAELDWSKVAWLSHNTRFDGAILAWRFGYLPRLYLDTLSMARATTHWWIGKSTLKAISEFLCLPPKGDEVLRAIGKRLEDFTPDELRAYAGYCVRDNENCREIFDWMRPNFCAEELQLIDLVMRMFIVPQIQLDTGILAEHHAHVVAEKERILSYVETIDKSRFASNQQFAELLEEYGVEVPYKRSQATGEWIPALARGDWAFKELCVDQSQPHEVQAILAARQCVKSTLEETRSKKLYELSLIEWPHQGTGWAPVPLKYYGARPGRLAGDGGMNWQNIMRGSPIRKAIKAPEGYRVVHRDASQIEARVAAWLAGCDALTDAFRTHVDVYCMFATIVYGREITKKDIKERFVGKTGVLGLNYGCGAAKFRHMLYIGNGGISVAVEPEEAERIVRYYRSTYYQIPELWRTAEAALRFSAERPLSRDRGRELLAFDQSGVSALTSMFQLPNRMKIMYPYLSYNDDGEMVYRDAYGCERKIYGAKAIENVCQALARIIVTDIAVRVYQLSGYHPFLTTHDSLDYCVPDCEAEDMNAELEAQFALVPSWATGLPLASEGGWGVTLHDAETMVNQ